MTELLAAISAGGDVAMIAIAGVVLKLDRRVVRLETILKMLLGEKKHGNEAQIG